MEPVIDIAHLTKRFGSLVAVNDISFQVAPGDVLGFLGPNGAGKSTTMKMLTGFISPDAGRISVGGYDIGVAPMPVKRMIGYLPEGAPLYGDMTVASFLKFIGEVRGFGGAELANRVAAVVDKVSLAEVLSQRLETLSKGFKRRVGLAQAILHDPQVLILDEPTDGLDPNQKHEVRELIRSMSRDKVIILSTHILEEVDAVCTRAVIISAGRIVWDGSPDELLAQSRWHNAVSVALKGTVGQEVIERFRRLPNVDDVEVASLGAGTRVHLFPTNGNPLLPSVHQLVSELGLDIEELQVERGRLDEVFRHVTSGTAS